MPEAALVPSDPNMFHMTSLVHHLLDIPRSQRASGWEGGY